LASKFVKGALTGTGGDDLFSGYPWRYYRAVANDDFDHYVKIYLDYWNRLVPAE
jgi:asparagine synthase (glutamine-hydrolysing)